MNNEEKKTFLMAVRQACFLIVDAIEVILCISPKTSELRKLYKR
jgi:hypothetical protein